MRIAIGSDHAGFAVKERLKRELKRLGHRVTDMGTDGEASTDYPDYAEKVGRAVVSGKASRGVLICGSGIGMAIAANKVRGVRAATITDRLSAVLSRNHNDADVFSAGARLLTPAKIAAALRVWLKTPFGGGRHVRRVRKISAIEKKR